MSDEKHSGGLLVKVVAGIFTAVVAPTVVVLLTKYLDPNRIGGGGTPSTASAGVPETGKPREGPRPTQKKGPHGQPEHGAAVSLITPNLADHFYSYGHDRITKGNVHNDGVDPKMFHFVPMPPSISVPGTILAGLVTKAEHHDYTLVLEYRFGNAKAPGGAKKARQAAVHIHATGPDGSYKEPWMQSIAVLLTDGIAGSLRLMADDGKVTGFGKFKQKAGSGPKPVRRDYDPSMLGAPIASGKPPKWSGIVYRLDTPEQIEDVQGFTYPSDIAKPDDWNRLEVTCIADSLRVRLNGKQVNGLDGLSVKKGRIVLTSEHADYSVRKFQLDPIK